MKTISYFAYGANLHPDVLQGDRGVDVKVKSTCCLTGYRLRFNACGMNFLEPAFANIEEHALSEVWGVTFDISSADFEKIKGSESAYRVVDINVKNKEGQAIVAKTLVSQNPLAGERKPSRRYLSLIQNGAKLNDFPEEYLTLLTNVQSRYIPIASETHDILLKIFKRLSFG